MTVPTKPHPTISRRQTALPPYYHPTTVCFIDDNYSFLRSIGIGMPVDSPFLSFLSPEEAIDVVNIPNPLPPLADRCLRMDLSKPANPLIHIDLHALEREIKEIERFRRISVLLIDYAMPTMTGLQFCELVADRDIKCALLTGVADEKTAVAAFNDGLIDRYIPKAGLTSTEGILPHIESLKQDYFDQYSRRLTSNLDLDPPRFMTDLAVREVFEQILRQERIIEYFMVSQPYGYLMLRADGSMLRFMVMDEDERAKSIQFAQQNNAPMDIIAQLTASKYIGYFSEDPADYLGHEPYPWAEMLVSAKRVEGDQVWYVGVLYDPPADVDFDPAASSYNKFLEGQASFM